MRIGKKPVEQKAFIVSGRDEASGQIGLDCGARGAKKINIDKRVTRSVTAPRKRRRRRVDMRSWPHNRGLTSYTALLSKARRTSSRIKQLRACLSRERSCCHPPLQLGPLREPCSQSRRNCSRQRRRYCCTMMLMGLSPGRMESRIKRTTENIPNHYTNTRLSS
jgi:hypothetical protein